MPHSLLRLIPAILFCSVASGCGDPTAGCTKTLAPDANPDTNHTNIQGALSAASPGSTVCFRPGTYAVKDELTVATDNLTLRSTTDGQATLDFKGQVHGANGITVVSVAGFTVKNLTVKNTPGDAIKVTQGDHVTFDHVTVTWDAMRATENGAYGLYPVQCTHVLIDGCTVSYASDAGIYVGQSNQILVRGSEAFGNVAGIEIENSNDAEVAGNNSHDNTGGILVFSLPNLNMVGGARAKVHGNKVQHNNGNNFAAKSSIVSIVPAGTGFLVMASDNNEIYDNDITANDSVGLAVISYFLTQMKIMNAGMYNPYPEGNYIHDNRFTGNGTDPSGLAYQIAIGLGEKTVDAMVWDGIVDGKKQNVNMALTNCFKNNAGGSFRSLGLMLDMADMPDIAHAMPSKDIAPYTCAHEPLAAITP